MTEVSLTCTTNWLHSDELSKAVQTNITNEDVFILPELDELINEERAILLTSITNDLKTIPACELQICIFPRYKIEAISILCTSPKLEIFIGKQKEYLQTVYGNKIIEETEENDSKETAALSSYRYDIELEKSGITELMLKFLTIAHDLCIYGIKLNVAPNQNGITTLLPGTIDLGNIEEALKTFHCKLSPNAEKCKMFMEKQAKFKEQTKLHIEQQQQQIPTFNDIKEIDDKLMDSNLKLFIENKFKELEDKINLRLDEITIKHIEKLDTIIRLLNNK